nr:hypothetical protein [Tanacetum cinerariifolium]
MMSEGIDDELKKITVLLAKAFNRKKFYSKPTNINLRTSSATSSTNKKQDYVKYDDKKEEKKVDEKKIDMIKVKCYNCKKEGHFTKDCKKAKDHAWMESSSELDQEINANMVFMEQMEKVLSDSEESSSSKEETIVEQNNKAKILKIKIKLLQDKCDVLQNQTNTFEMKSNELKEQIKVLIQKNDDLLAQMSVLQDQLKVKHVMIDTHTECQAKYAKLEAKRYEYMIRYSAYFNNDKQHRMQIADQEILFDKMSHQLVELDENVRILKNTVLEKDLKISKLDESKDLRPTLYDERVIGLGYTSRFLTHSDEALEIKKFKRARDNKIEFTYDYGNLNASYVNEKINFSDNYFQKIINPDFGKIGSPFPQTSSLKPDVPTVILEKIIIDLEDEVVSLLEKEKANLEIIKSLKSKGSESSENAISESKNQSENDCHVVEKGCDNLKNSTVIAPGIFKINVSQSVSPFIV